MARAKYDENYQPYKNMKARKGVLLWGFFSSLAGFALIVFTSLVFFAPQLFPNDFVTFEASLYLIITSLALCFVGAVFSVTGANTAQSLARFSFFLCSIGFVWGAGMLTVALAFKHLLPLDAINRVLS